MECSVWENLQTHYALQSKVLQGSGLFEMVWNVTLGGV